MNSYTGAIRKSTRKNFGIPPTRFSDSEYWLSENAGNQASNCNIDNFGQEYEDFVDENSHTTVIESTPTVIESIQGMSKASSKKSRSIRSSKSKLTESIQTLKSLQEMDELEQEMAAIKVEEIETRKLEVIRRMERLKQIETQKLMVQKLADEESMSEEEQDNETFFSIKDERVGSWVEKHAQLKPTNSWHGGFVQSNEQVKTPTILKRVNSVKTIDFNVRENGMPPKQFQSQIFKGFSSQSQQFGGAGPQSQQYGGEGPQSQQYGGAGPQSQQFIDIPLTQNGDVTSNDVLLAAFKALQIKQIRDLPVFDGENVLDWPNFAAEFRRSTREYNIQSESNLRRLNYALKGIARESVYALLSHPENVEEIISTLEMNFGRPEWIIVKLLSDIRAFPAMKEEGIEQFRSFYNKIHTVSSTMKNMNAEVYIDSPDLLNSMEEKLPPTTRNYWIRYKADLLRNKKKVNLQVLGEWFKFELDAQYAGISSRDMQKKQHNGPNTNNQYRKANVFANFQNNNGPRLPYCILCKEKGHALIDCKAFKEMSIHDRRQVALKENLCFLCLGKNHSVKICQKKEKIGKCTKCQVYHNELVHLDREEEVHNVSCSNNVLLRIGKVKVKGPKGIATVFAFFDEGSTATMIDDSLACELGLVGPKSPITYRWTNEIVRTDFESMLIDTEVSGPDEKSKFYELLNVRTVKNLALPHQKLNTEHIMKTHPYVDQQKIESVKDAQPMILIGSNNSGLIVPLRTIQYKLNGLQQCKSRLGWTVHGNVEEDVKDNSANFSLYIHVCIESKKDMQLNELIKQSYMTENFGINDEKEKLAEEDEKAIEIMKNTMTYVGDRFEIGQLYRYPGKAFPTAESKVVALKRLRFVEQKMDKDPNFAKAYMDKIGEYVSKNYAEKLDSNDLCEPPNTFYLPHFGVYNVNKPGKFRWVMDAKAKAGNFSLNDLLLQGPDFVPPLLAVIWRTRTKKVAISADIREMFHQVMIRPEDRDSQRFLFRGLDRDREPDVYRMKAMIFGAVSSPSMAQFVKNENAKRMEDQYPGVVRAITQQHYVDDYFDCADTVEEANQIASNVITVHKTGGFELVKWISNSKEFMDAIPDQLKLPESDKIMTVRVLGLTWNIQSDCFEFNTKFDTEMSCANVVLTKRQLLRFMMSIFDPVGFLAPLVIKLKILFQELWRLDIKWDEKVPPSIHEKLVNWFNEAEQIGQVNIPRCYFPLLSSYSKIEMHVIVDACEQAYSAVTYLRVRINDQVYDTSFVQAKSRVAPVKSLTIPRLELQASVMGSQMANKIRDELNIQIENTFYWTDSTCVLSWINTKEKLCSYVGSRISKILDVSETKQWNWIPTEKNSADLATKTTNSVDLSSESFWFKGPTFLRQSELPHFVPPTMSEEQIFMVLSEFEEEKSHEKIFFELPDLDRFSNFNRLIRSTAFVLKIVKNLKLKKQERPDQLTIDVHDINEAKKLWYKKVQYDTYNKEIRDLKKTGFVKKSSQIYQLSPFVNEEGILCMKGRIPGYDPVILCQNHKFTRLLVTWYHIHNLHKGVDTVINHLRESFWIPKCRTVVRSVFKACLKCKLREPKIKPVQMGDVPKIRSEKCEYAFTYVGIDYFGPMFVKVGRKIFKVWGALFTCMTTRGIHVELVYSLTTNSAIMAITRFMNLRGVPLRIYSDNATCFEGSKNELEKFRATLDHQEISDKLSIRDVEWSMIPPASPHFGGAWERMVRSVKEGLKVLIDIEVPSHEVLSTALSEIVNTINNRPLTYVSSEPHDLRPLSPNDIILLRTNHSQYNTKMEYNYNPKTTWKLAHQLADNFWSRWIKEYRPLLLKRNKWHDNSKDPNLKIGDVVLILDDNMIRGQFIRGIVIKVYPDKEGRVRVAQVKTNTGVYKRPVTKLAKIDTSGGFENDI